MSTRFIATKRIQDGQDINMTPLLDVVFIMLIFFIVTTSFQRETALEVSRPAASTDNNPVSQLFAIRIDANDRVHLGQREISIDAVRVNASRHAIDQSGIEVRAAVVADVLSSNGVLIRVVDQIQSAGISSVSVVSR